MAPVEHFLLVLLEQAVKGLGDGGHLFLEQIAQNQITECVKEILLLSGQRKGRLACHAGAIYSFECRKFRSSSGISALISVKLTWITMPAKLEYC